MLIRYYFPINLIKLLHYSFLRLARPVFFIFIYREYSYYKVLLCKDFANFITIALLLIFKKCKLFFKQGVDIKSLLDTMEDVGNMRKIST